MTATSRYFQNLNYTSTNEDTLLELEVMRPEEEHLLAIAGSGARVLPLLSKVTKKVTCVDYSLEQLYLTQLRLAALQYFSYEEYCSFIGYGPTLMSPTERKQALASLPLCPTGRHYLTSFFENNKWRSPLNKGRWEQAMRKLGKYIVDMLGELPSFETKDSPIFHFALFFSASPSFFNSTLYRGSFPRVNLAKTHYHYHKELFIRLLSKWSIDDNYLLQTIFKGRMSLGKDYPAEVDPIIYQQSKERLKNIEVIYKQGSLFSVLKKERDSFSFISLSDIPSYFEPKVGKSFMVDLLPHLKSKGRVVARYYCHKPKPMKTDFYNSLLEEYKSNIENERTQIYHFDIFEKEF